MTLSANDPEPQVTLTDQARRRLSNQIARAYRGPWSASTGLRALARSIARRLLGAGWSTDVVSAALVRVVSEHPACTGVRRHLGTTEHRSLALAELMRQSVKEVALELSQSSSS